MGFIMLVSAQVNLRRFRHLFFGMPKQAGSALSTVDSSSAQNPWSLTDLGPVPPHLHTTRDQHRANYQAKSILNYVAQKGLPVHRFHIYSPERKIFQASLALTMLLCEVADIKEEGVLSLGKHFRQVHDILWKDIQAHISPLITQQ